MITFRKASVNRANRHADRRTLPDATGADDSEVTESGSWFLMDDDRFLALLTVTGSDITWSSATLAPAPAVESWRPVFDDERRAIDRIDNDPEAWEAAYDIIGSALTLRDPDGNDGEAFLLHIDGDPARWRWA